MTDDGNPNIHVEITDAREFHCFRLVLGASVEQPGGEREEVEVLFHARSLVDLIHKCSTALCEWQKQTTEYLLDEMGAPRIHDPAAFQQLLDAIAEGQCRTVEIFQEMPKP